MEVTPTGQLGKFAVRAAVKELNPVSGFAPILPLLGTAAIVPI